ncbi:AzlD domain-containing protein [Xanthobacter sp. KR7-65]|uniref:AzlD domain-containing protein n=1 Tax=Xanthobacter sp. KR7-65 TaxID=3156612 RepID=UPI0032B39C04
MNGQLSEGAALLLVVLLGFLPTEVWRSLAVVAGRRVSDGSPLFHWVKAVATALLAAVVARLLFNPAGALAAVPLALRLGAVAAGVCGFTLLRRSVFAGVLVGEVVLIGGAWLLTG